MKNKEGEIIMRNSKDNLAFVVGVVTSIVTVLSLIVAIFALIDKKKKREEKELEEYLDASIN